MKIITADDIAVFYERLSTIGVLGDSPSAGYLRSGWSVEEEAAFSFVREEAEKCGLKARYDEIGNLALEQAGFTQYVECGSHLDTVYRGGNFDGAAGIIAGLAAIRANISAQARSKCGFRLRIWRGEESDSYAFGCKGSRAAFGVLAPEALLKTFRNQTLEQAISARGYNPECIRSKRRTISLGEVDGIRAHLELHIEQANSLEQQNIDIGVVNSIRGPSRWTILLRGRFDHSGGTPMGQKYRKDVNLALAYMLVELDRLALAALEKGDDLVQTVGVINCDPQLSGERTEIQQNAVAKVSGFGYFKLDVRSRDLAFRTRYVHSALQAIEIIAREYGIEAQIEKISETDPCDALDGNIQAIELAAAKSLGYSVISIPSGAVHDCLYVAEQKRNDGTGVPIGMIFIPCRDGVSHAPEEYTSFDAIAKGANVLAKSMFALAQ